MPECAIGLLHCDHCLRYVHIWVSNRTFLLFLIPTLSLCLVAGWVGGVHVMPRSAAISSLPPHGGGGGVASLAGWVVCQGVLFVLSGLCVIAVQNPPRGRLCGGQNSVLLLGRFPRSLPSLGVSPGRCACAAPRSSMSLMERVHLCGRSSWKTRWAPATGTAYSGSWACSAAIRGAGS